jgi:putative DNA primase/helicase
MKPRAHKLRQHLQQLLTPPVALAHDQVWQEILDHLQPLDFAAEANVGAGKSPSQADYVVVTVRSVLQVAQTIQCGLCKRLDFVYAFNGAYWREIPKDALSQFLGAAAVKLGVPAIKAEHWHFRESLLKQFFATAYLPEPIRQDDVTLINFRNGTLEISSQGWHLRAFERHDFLTYQLPFDFDETRDAPQWQQFLDRVQPDVACQRILAEYIGYCFTRGLKLEKVLLLYGSGANGKSVFCDVISALLGAENISHYSLSSLSELQGYFRARLVNKLLNYGSELDARLQTDLFKQLASGERIQARLPYGQPFELRDYAKLAFNCNELPRDVEHSEAYFRRFLVIPFTVTIPEAERNVELATEIIRTELSGVFNWVLAGLKRLLAQKNFTASDAAKIALAEYRRESDSVMMFLEEEEYAPSLEGWVRLKTLYAEYRSYCLEGGFKPLGRGKFGARLRANQIVLEKERSSFVVYVSRA